MRGASNWPSLSSLSYLSYHQLSFYVWPFIFISFARGPIIKPIALGPFTNTGYVSRHILFSVILIVNDFIGLKPIIKNFGINCVYKQSFSLSLCEGKNFFCQNLPFESISGIARATKTPDGASRVPRPIMKRIQQSSCQNCLNRSNSIIYARPWLSELRLDGAAFINWSRCHGYGTFRGVFFPFVCTNFLHFFMGVRGGVDDGRTK